MYKFSKIALDSRQIFFRSEFSLGLVNLKPLIPGHVLVIPIRSVQRFYYLRDEEVADLFLSVKVISRVVERVFKGTSLTIAMQDGPEAGQSVPHVHVHILPRISNDWPVKDQVYEDVRLNLAVNPIDLTLVVE